MLLVPMAFAVDLSAQRVGLSVGYEFVANDPFLYRRGWRHGVTWQPSPWAEVGATVTWYPILGNGGENDADWKPLSKQLLLENSVSPDISKMWLQAQLVARVRAFRAPLGGEWEGSAGVLVGGAVFVTSDDLVALQNDGEEAMATQNQVHPGLAYGLFADMTTEYVGFRLRAESDAYIEVVNSTNLEMKRNLIFGVEVLCWF